MYDVGMRGRSPIKWRGSVEIIEGESGKEIKSYGDCKSGIYG